MGFEIERKFLVRGEYKHLATQKISIKQGYLSTIPNRTVRIRITDTRGYITIKGEPKLNKATRFEWEREIPLDEALQLMELCGSDTIIKTRYIIPEKSGLVFEVDQFHDRNKGLVIAEIEIPHKAYSICKPDWLGKEVTGDPLYYNSYLNQTPYSTW